MKALIREINTHQAFS